MISQHPSVMIGKVTLREIVENALDRVDFDRASERKKIVSVLLGAMNIFLDGERQAAVEALASVPEAQQVLKRHWRLR